MLFQAILVSSPGPCEPTCGLPLHETSLWVFHFDSDVLTTIICMVVNQTILSFELPSNLSYKSALQFQSLRINHFDLGSEIELYLLTFLISFPGSCEPIFWLPLHELTHFIGFHLDSDVLITRICICVYPQHLFLWVFPSNLSCGFHLNIIPCGFTSWFWLCRISTFASFFPS